MTTIALIDADSVLLKKQAKSLSKTRPEWEILTATSAADAVILVESHPIDLLVTEAQLPDMQGFQLLEKVKNLKPEIIRFTLSSDSESEVILECARVHHRFLAKPLEADALAETMESSLELRTILANEQLMTFMQSVESLPAIPALYDELVAELASKNSSLMKVAEIIEGDAGLTLTILKVVNSAYCGLTQSVESVSQAISLLGASFVKNITLTSKVFSKFEGDKSTLKKLTELNQDALKVGALTNQFARYAKVPRSSVNHCQVAGMMFNIGELIALTAESDDMAENTPSHLLGAYLMRSWMMPDAVTEAVALQHEEITENPGKVTPLVILHSIRYLQEHYIDTANMEQRQQCEEYLSSFVAPFLVDIWLDTYQALEQLASSGDQEAA
ncbi:MAG: HDOD domain-containing protein [Granulosicoccus sp.]